MARRTRAYLGVDIEAALAFFIDALHRDVLGVDAAAKYGCVDEVGRTRHFDRVGGRPVLPPVAQS